MKKNLTFLLLVGVLLLSICLTFYKLGQNPSGLNQDETAIGYNAYSILVTGKDEHGAAMPLYFKSFNDYKLPVYIYLTTASEKVFGLTPFAVRFPSAVFGVLTVLAFFFLVRELVKNDYLALLSALLLSINPWHIFFSRVAFEVNVALSFLVFGALFFILAVKRNNSILFYSLSILNIGLSLYCYNVTRAFAPILLITLIFLYHRLFFNQSRKKLFILFGFFVLIVIPFSFTFFNHSGFANQQNVLITGGDAKASMIEFRSYLTSLPHPFTALFFNSSLLLIWQYGKNIVTSLSPSFFFNSAGIPGGDVGVVNVGMFYPIEFFTIILGIIFLIKKRAKHLIFFALWGILLLLLVSISANVPVGTRNYPVLISLVFFSAYGIYESLFFIKQHSNKFFIPSVIFLIVMIGYGFVYFQTSYYFRFPIAYAKSWRSEDEQMSVFLKKVDFKYDHIIVDKDADFVYTSLIFFQHYSPQQFQANVIYEPDELFTSVKKIGKYEFHKIDWQKEGNMPNTLFITKNYPSEFTLLQSFTYPTRPVVLSVEGKIYQYPVTDVAYDLVTKK